jgi:NCS1 family nucleobase:cation symporter-1
MGVMAADYYVIRGQSINLTDLYHPHEGKYWYYHGFNLRVIVPWLVGWGPTVVGLISTVNQDIIVPAGVTQLYFLSFFYGFFVSAALFIGISKIFPPAGLGEKDVSDVFGTFTRAEAIKLSVEPVVKSTQVIEGVNELDLGLEVKPE